MPRDGPSPEGSQGSPPGQPSEGAPSQRRSRRRGMPEDERRARQRRRRRFHGRLGSRDDRDEDEEVKNEASEDQREEKNRIGERLEMLDWALDTSQCEDEVVNIRAAIQGYQSGEIPYSSNFTLIYAGHIVDFCPTYQSFCEDRQARLDRYYAKFGPGWLWHEPPLAESRFEALAKKGLCLRRQRKRSNYNIGHYPVYQRFTVNKGFVMKAGVKPHRDAVDDSQPFANPASCVLETLLDSGATYPILPADDLEHFGITMKWYPAQGIMRLATITGKATRRFFEMHVSVCSETGKSLVGDQAVWPQEPQVGGLDRISGMLPFESCYMSSAPTTYEFWLGEDRRDVLGARRLPAHLRWSPEKTVWMKYSKEFASLRQSARTPDQVIFIHHLDEEGKRTLVDQDWPGVRGRSELAIMEKEVDEPTQRLVTRKKKNVVLEPREGTFKQREKNSRYQWREDLLTLEDIASQDYEDVGDGLPKEPRE